MSREIRDINDGLGLLYTAKGETHHAEYLAVRDLLEQQVDPARLRLLIIDTREETGNATTTEELRREAEDSIDDSRRLPHKLIVAIVVSRDLSFGLGRMWETFAEETGWVVKVLRDMDEAEAWIQDEYRRAFGEALGDIVPGRVLVTGH